MNLDIKKITVEETYAIREKELRKNMDLSAQFSGDFDKDTLHLGLFRNNKLVSIVSFMKKNNNLFTGEQYQLRGMATLEDFQGNDYGKMLILRAEEILKNKNIEIVWCNARITALEFYKKRGYLIIGAEFNIPQIGGHFLMSKNLL